MSRILIAGTKDVRVFVLDTTKIAKEAIKNSCLEDMFTTSEIALLNIAAIMSNNIKSEKSKISIVLKANGLLGNAKARALYDGRVVSNISINKEELEKLNEASSLSEFKEIYKIGSGTVLVEVDNGLKFPYLTTLNIGEYETIEEVFEDYYLNSEQLDTIIKTSIKLDDNNKLVNSGALFIQLLPNGDKEIFKLLEEKVKMLHSVSEMLYHNFSLEKILELLFEDVRENKTSDKIAEYNILANKELRFSCTCSRDYFKQLLEATTSKEELEDLFKENTQVETICGFCNSVYFFDKKDLGVI